LDVSRTPDSNMHAPVADLTRGLPISPAMIEAAEHVTLQLPQVSCPVVHHFGPGICVREVFMPAGTFAIGHRQRYPHVNIFLKGRVTVIHDDGSTSDLVAPMLFVGEPGRKVGYVQEDVVWLNVWPTDETDVEKIEAHFLDKTVTWAEHAAHDHMARSLERQADRDDFASAIAELGFTPEQVRQVSENVADLIPFPQGHYKVRLSASPIEGKGLFATSDIQPGEVIAPGRIDGRRTPAGRYTNHAKVPNARFQLVNERGDMDLVAIAPIAGCRGGADGDEITVDYRQSVAESKKFVNKG
jgi:hypothetical protein